MNKPGDLFICGMCNSLNLMSNYSDMNYFVIGSFIEMALTDVEH